MADENRESVTEEMENAAEAGNQAQGGEPETAAGETAEAEKKGAGEPAESGEPETGAGEKAEENSGEESSEAEEAPKEDPQAAAEAKIAELTDRLQRQMAEFENFRRRSEKEKAAMFEMGARSVIEKMLPVIDNFERGLASITSEQAEDPFASGMEKIYKQLMGEMENLGVKPIEAKGQNFDPNLHNAVMHIDDDTIDENIVVEEFQKGYTYRDSVIRYSMVKVAN